MVRLIDADALQKDIAELPNCSNGFSDTYDKAMILSVIDEQPTIDAIPVEWIKRWSKEPMTEKDMKLAEQCEWNILEWLIADWQKRKEE